MKAVCLILIKIMISGLFVDGSFVLFSANGTVLKASGVSPTVSKYIGPQAGEDGCSLRNVTIKSLLKLTNSSFCDLNKELTPFQKSLTGHAIILGNLGVGAGGTCSFELRYKRLIQIGVTAIISATEGTQSLKLYSHDGSLGINGLNSTGPMLLAVSSSDTLLVKEMKDGDILQIECTANNPWEAVYNGPIWLSLIYVYAVGFIGTAILALIYARSFIYVTYFKHNTDKTNHEGNAAIILILLINFGTCLSMGIYCALGYVGGSPLLSTGVGGAFNSQLVGLMTFALALNAVYLREYTVAIKSLRKPKLVFRKYKYTIIALAVVLIGFDVVRMILISVYISAPALAAISGMIYTVSGLYIAGLFAYYGESFISAVAKGKIKLSDNSQSPKKSTRGEVIPHTIVEDKITKFIIRMSKWLRICTISQIVMSFSIIYVVTGLKDKPDGFIQLVFLAGIPRVLIPFAQVMALRPAMSQKGAEKQATPVVNDVDVNSGYTTNNAKSVSLVLGTSNTDNAQPSAS